MSAFEPASVRGAFKTARKHVTTKTIDDVAETWLVPYGAKSGYGIPQGNLLLEPKESLELSLEDFLYMFNSKSYYNTEPWKRVQAKHMAVIRSERDHVVPADWQEGDVGPNGETCYEDFPHATYYYVCAHAKENVDDPGSANKARCDKRTLRPCLEKISEALHNYFLSLPFLQNTAERARRNAPLLEWQVPPRPQAQPDKEPFVPYIGLHLDTAYLKKKPTPRAKVEKEATATANKRKVDMASDDSGDMTNVDVKPPYKRRVTTVSVKDAKLTTVHIVPGHNMVEITEYL
jgi:hypothetical protein